MDECGERALNDSTLQQKMESMWSLRQFVALLILTVMDAVECRFVSRLRSWAAHNVYGRGRPQGTDE